LLSRASAIHQPFSAVGSELVFLWWCSSKQGGSEDFPASQYFPFHTRYFVWVNLASLTCGDQPQTDARNPHRAVPGFKSSGARIPPPSLIRFMIRGKSKYKEASETGEKTIVSDLDISASLR
jgi:hypothetical protein